MLNHHQSPNIHISVLTTSFVSLVFLQLCKLFWFLASLRLETSFFEKIWKTYSKNAPEKGDALKMCLWSHREGPNQKSFQNRPLLKFNFTPENTLIYSILDIFKAFLAILKFLKNFIKTLTDAPGSEKKIFFLDFLEYFNLTHNPIPSTFQKNDFWKIVGVLM